MKKMIALMSSVLLVASVGFAKNTKEHSVDTSHNPITGTDTTTEKTSETMKTAHGTKEVKTKKKTKKHRDGSAETTTDVKEKTEETH